MCESEEEVSEVKTEAENSQKTEKPGSIFRDTALRYAGYMSHIGWLCRQTLPYYTTRMVTLAYVCADTFVRTSASAAREDPETLRTAGDAVLWHFLASFAIPGIFLQGIHSLIYKLQSSRSKCNPRSRFFLLPCAFGTITLPFISSPIDRAVDEFMDKYIRKCQNEILKEDIVSKIDDDNECNHEEVDSKAEDKNKWFYDKSKDELALDLERYNQKLKDARERESRLSSNRQNKKDGSITRAIQVDRYDRPPKDLKPKL